MLKIFLISVGFCIFIPLQVEACPLAFRGESLSQILVIRDMGLSLRHVEAFKEVGIHTTEDLRQTSRRELVAIFSRAKLGAQFYVQKVEAYLLTRGESLARDFLVDDVKLPVAIANALNRADIRTEEDLLEWTESGLLTLPGVAKITAENIKVYLFSRRKFLARDFLLDDVGLFVETAGALRMAGVDTVDSLRALSRQELRRILSIGYRKTGGRNQKIEIKKIETYLSNRGESLVQDLVTEDIGLSPRHVEALKEAGIHTIEDLRQFSRRELFVILSRAKLEQYFTVKRVETYLLFRGESLAQDFLMKDMGLPFKKANTLFREGIRTEEDLLGWTESGLLALPGVGQITVANIKNYFLEKGKSLARNF